jgi:hypothetical protein
MAKQTGIIKLKGKIGDLSFYKSKDGHLAREKGGVEAERIKNDPAFVRTRENNSEFGTSASAGKFTRDSLRPIALTASDNRVVARMTKLMTQIKNLDTTSDRGSRNVGVAMTTAQAKALLKGFDFNQGALLGSILYKPWLLDTATGEIAINGLVPANDITFPSGATHVTISGAAAALDFVTNTSEINLTNLVNLPINGNSTGVSLSPASVPTGPGVKVFLLKVEFFQQVNGQQYSLKNGAYNSLKIIEVI